MTNPVLETRAMSMAYGALKVFDQINFSLLPGERHAVIGPNGAGKSTFIGLLSGALTPVSGHIYIAGVDVTKRNAVARARGGIGRTFQINSLFQDMSPLQSVALVLAQANGGGHPWKRLSRNSALVDEACAILSRFGLSKVAMTTTRLLAYGEQRLLEVALAYAQKPKILLLDEPVAGLTTAQGEALFDLLSSLGREVSLLFIEHDMPIVYGYADRISVLAEGRIMANGTADEIRSNPDVRAAYLGK